MYMRMLIMMAVSLYTTRVVLSTLGVDDYGIYNVVGGLVVFFSFINAGLAGATKRYVLAELAVGNLKTQRAVFSLALNAHLLIVALVLIAGETIGLWILNNAMNIPESRIYAASMVYQASLFTAVIGILQSPFSSVIISFEKMAIYAYLSIMDVLLKLFIVFIVQIIDGDRLIWYAFLLCLISLVDILIYYIYCRNKFEMCRYVKTNDNSTFKSILKYVGWTVFGSGTNVLSHQGVNILVNNFFSVAVNAAMGISNMIVNAASQFVSNLQVAFAPQLTKNYISKDYNQLIKLIFQSSRYTSFLILIILIPIVFIIPDLLLVWLGDYPKYTEGFCILALICIFIDSVSMPLTTVITADSNIKRYQVIISGLYIVVFFISWGVLFLDVLPYVVLLVRGAIGFIMALFRLVLIKKRVPSFSILMWCKEVYGKSLIMATLSVPLFAIFHNLYIDDLLLRLTIMSIICFAWIIAIICLVGLSHDEKRFVLSKIRNHINR